MSTGRTRHRWWPPTAGRRKRNPDAAAGAGTPRHSPQWSCAGAGRSARRTARRAGRTRRSPSRAARCGRPCAGSGRRSPCRCSPAGGRRAGRRPTGTGTCPARTASRRPRGDGRGRPWGRTGWAPGTSPAPPSSPASGPRSHSAMAAVYLWPGMSSVCSVISGHLTNLCPVERIPGAQKSPSRRRGRRAVAALSRQHGSLRSRAALVMVRSVARSAGSSRAGSAATGRLATTRPGVCGTRHRPPVCPSSARLEGARSGC